MSSASAHSSSPPHTGSLPDPNDVAIVIKELRKSFPGKEAPALDAVSSKVAFGKMSGLVGPDGAGKTTLIRLMVGLLRPDSGSVRVAGFDAASQAARIHAVTGYMPQKFGLYEDLSVIENLRLYAELRAVPVAVRQAKFERLLRFTSLEAFQARLAGKLSGGMKQKLGLACALLGEPRVLLLDEPSVGVDPISRRELWEMVQDLLSGGMAVVWSTSYLDEAEKCDAVLLLNEGKLVYDGPPADILKRVEGRVWQLRGLAVEERRSALMRLLRLPDVNDAVLQGQALRIVTATGTEPPASRADYAEATGHHAGINWATAAPCFEDAFIDILGGGPGGLSALGEEITEKAHTDMPVIDARNLTKRFGDFVAVRDNNFQIRRGEIFGLLGPNGAGKSTTFKMMCGLLQPSSGSAMVMGLDLKKSSAQARARIGYMAQKFSLYGSISVLHNLRFFAGVYGLSGREKKQRIDLMISLFNLESLLNMSAGLLPLGFKQRLALACSVMHEPDVLFLDEPTSGVDPVTRREFWLHINAMVQKGVTVMVTTHFMDEAEYCDRIALIYRGENIADGTPDDLKQQASSESLPEPTLEDAFIALVSQNDRE